MAKITNVFDTYQATSNREALSNMIYDISPTTTPFMSSIGKNNVKNTNFSWQTESLASASGTGHTEGFENSRTVANPTVRPTNQCQISKRDATVSGTQQASDPAGKKSEMAHQLAIMSKALKRDMEVALCQNATPNAGSTASTGTARQTRPFESWITSNKSRGTNGANGSATAGATDGTQRDLTETLLKTVLQSCFTNGAEPSMAICGPGVKGVISGFTGRSNVRQVINSDTVEASVSVYASDFGTLKIVPSNFSRARSLLLVDPDYAKVSYLRSFDTVDLAKIGDAQTKMIVVEYGLEMSNESAHGIVADLNT